jgi:hypothetical protein
MRRERLRRVMQAEPMLGRHGMLGHDLDFDEQDADRARLLSDQGLKEFECALSFVERLAKTKTFRMRGTSYGLKHCAERFCRAGPYRGREDEAYISNGALIAAALASGFKIKRSCSYSPNVHINVSLRSLERVCRR